VKILMTTHYFASHQGGIEIVAGQLFREFAGLEQAVVWIAADASPLPETSGTVRSVGLRVFNFVERKIGLPFPIPTPGALAKVRDEVRRADVVIVHDCLYLTNIVAYVFARLARVPVMIIQHIGLVPYSNQLLSGMMKLANRLVTRPMLRGAQQVVFISETTKRHFSGVHFQTPPAIVFNGVDIDVFRPLHPTENKFDLRREFGLPIDRPAILFVGRFVEKKGLPVLKRMAEMSPGYTWAFAGWGILDPRKWNAANVHVFSDLRDSRLADLYRASDLLVLPSTGEGFPLVIQEALACGLAVVCGAETATADPAMISLIHGAELRPGDDDTSAQSFMAAIEDLIGPASKVTDQRDERRRFVLSRYSWRKAAERYLEIASHLAPENSRPPAALPEKSVCGSSVDRGTCLGPREVSS
jgi:glycosyltransferase involved in cell wall biosynthesis